MDPGPILTYLYAHWAVKNGNIVLDGPKADYSIDLHATIDEIEEVTLLQERVLRQLQAEDDEANELASGKITPTSTWNLLVENKAHYRPPTTTQALTPIVKDSQLTENDTDTETMKLT